MRQHYRWSFTLGVSITLAGVTLSGQTFTPVQVIGQFGQVYPENEYWVTDPIAGTCAAGQTCPGDPQQLPGSFNAPNDVAVDGAGRLVVADSYNHRVQVFAPDGTHEFTIGGLGSLGIPEEWVPVFPGYTGDVIDPLTNALDLRFFYPMGVETDAAGKIVVADYYNHRIAIFHPDGRLFEVFGEYADATAGPVDAALGRFNYPYRVAVRPGTRLGDPMDREGRLYVLDQANNRVQMFDTALRPLGAFAAVNTDGMDPEQYYFPSDLAYDALHDQLLVPEAYTDRIQVFTADGAFQFVFGAADLVGPIGVAVGPDGRIYAADVYDRVHIFEQDGHTIHHVSDFGGSGTLAGEFSYPAGVTYGGYGRVVVADQDNHRIQIFEDEDQPADTIPPVSTAHLLVTPNAAGWVNAEQAVTFTATDVGSGVETIVIDYVLPDRPAMHVPSGTTFRFTDGVYVIEYYAIDRAGNREMPANRVEVRVDTAVPSLTCTGNTQEIWPVNHKMVPVSFNVTSTDALSGPNGFVLVSAASSEPDNGLGDGDQANDLQGWTLGAADASGFVRAERSGKGVGRIYSFQFESRDQAGNVATCSVATVKVPRSNRN